MDELGFLETPQRERESTRLKLQWFRQSRRKNCRKGEHRDMAQ